jgi:hypothetical protein
MFSERTLRVLGISAKLATGIIILGALAAIYKSYYELKLTRLQLEKIEKELEQEKK